jgi:hypothetical protein
MEEFDANELVLPELDLSTPLYSVIFDAAVEYPPGSFTFDPEKNLFYPRSWQTPSD